MKKTACDDDDEGKKKKKKRPFSSGLSDISPSQAAKLEKSFETEAGGHERRDQNEARKTRGKQRHTQGGTKTGFTTPQIVNSRSNFLSLVHSSAEVDTFFHILLTGGEGVTKPRLVKLADPNARALSLEDLIPEELCAAAACQGPVAANKQLMHG